MLDFACGMGAGERNVAGKPAWEFGRWVAGPIINIITALPHKPGKPHWRRPKGRLRQLALWQSGCWRKGMLLASACKNAWLGGLGHIRDG